MNEKLKIPSVYIIISLIWGSTWLAIRIGLESLTPFLSAGLRFLVAALVIYLLMLIKKLPIQKDKIAVKLYFLMGFFSFIIPFGLVYWGQQFIASGLASVLFGVYPFFVAIFSKIVMPKEKIELVKIIGMVLGFVGIIFIFSDNLDFKLDSDFLGMSAVLLSGIMQSTIAVTIKKNGKHLNSLSMNLIPMLLAGIVMTAGAFFVEDLSRVKFDFKAVSTVLYLGVFGSVVTFTSYYWLLKRINILLLSLIAFITPVIAMLLGWIFYNETLQNHHLIGSGFVLIGLLFANLSNIKLKNKLYTGLR
jgi:drug/metabolite transporter (DMT)-like permease